MAWRSAALDRGPLLAIVAVVGLMFIGGAVSEVLSDVGNTL